jgi:two-component system, OmpR family, phosphate regulon sensor histidine kinase PhoR
MSASADSLDEIRQQLELAQQQALRYGSDLAELFKEERIKREELELTNQKLYAALNSMTDALAVFDADLRLTEANPAFYDMFEIDVENAIAKSLIELIQGSGISELLNRMERRSGHLKRQEIKISEPLRKTISVDAAPITSRGIEGWVLVMHDVTQERRIENLRNEFINIAAHELRTPLAGLIGFTSVMLMDREAMHLNDEAASIIESVLTSSERLNKAVNELIQFAVADQAEITLSQQDLTIIIKDAILVTTAKATEKQVEVISEFGDMERPVFADAPILSTAFMHIIKNGIIFNKPNGFVNIRIKEDEEHYAIEIEDSASASPGQTRKEFSMRSTR